MNKHLGALIAALLALPAIPTLLAAEDHPTKHKRYTLVDVGTFGGPNSDLTFGAVIINRKGTLVGAADTSIPAEPCNPFWTPACVVSQASRLRDGVLTNLGALPGGQNSFAISINTPGAIVGVSENGLVDPVFGAEFVATLWKKNGGIVDLGTLGGSFSLPNSVNDSGQAAGGAENRIPDPDNLGGALIGLPSPTLWHAALWQNGIAQDLGTLADGPASFALFVNERGQVAGMSYTNSVPNPSTGIPTIDPFFWDNGQMVDVGTLGGVLGGVGGLNNKGQVAGTSNLPGDQTNHAFLWERGTLLDLGTLGGSSSFGSWIDDSGEVVGGSFTASDATFRAFRWKQGQMTNLGSLNGDPCSVAFSSNSKGQIVGNSLSDCDHLSRAFLWEDGGPMVDLNDLIPPDSGVLLHEGAFIGEGGEIACVGLLPNGDERAFLLIAREKDDEGDDSASGLAAARDHAAPTTQSLRNEGRSALTSEKLAALRTRILKLHRGVGLPSPK